MQNEKINASDSADAEVSQTPAPKVAPLPGMLAEGTKVSINKTTLKGEVSGYHLSADNKTFSYSVTFTDEEGENHEKMLLHSQITEIKEETV